MPSLLCEKCDNKYSDNLKAEYEWCKPCQIKDLENNFTSWDNNEKIGNLVQEMRSKINDPNDIIFEWIPYDSQFNDIKETSIVTVHSATWKNGPLSCNYFKKELTRVSNKKVALKSLNNSRNFIDEFLNKVKEYSINHLDDIIRIYGISQNPDTKDYIMVLHNEYFEKYYKKCCKKCDKIYTNTEYKWCNYCHIDYLKRSQLKDCTSKDEKINNYIQEMQLKINNPCTVVFEWIPYYQFNENNIKEIGKSGLVTVYLATWKVGPLYYGHMDGWTRETDKKVTLKSLKSSQNFINEFLNEVKKYSISYLDDNLKIYGISQNPDTKDYIMVLQNEYCDKCVQCNQDCLPTSYCKYCVQDYLKSEFSNWTSRDDDIDNLIQNHQMATLTPNKIIEWIPFENLQNIKIQDGIYTASWIDGSYKEWDFKEQQLKRFGAHNVILETSEDIRVKRLNHT